ncbi:MAG TPA: T9SS-dependent M36 family metallopeptidase, partial [Cryomorphaceae bacterium]|nr:T9SS-dependent M36 family metallopeptidase [Cryomorphaceae bacterium]
MRKILLFCGVFIFSLLCTGAFAQESQIGEVQEWLSDNGDWKNDDISNLVVTHSYRSNHNGATHLYASQSHNGIRIANSYLSATFNKDGDLIHVAPRLLRDISSKISGSQNLSLLQAIESQLLETIPQLEVIISLEKDGFGRQKLTLNGLNYSHDARAELVYYADAEEGISLAWTFDAELPSQDHWYFYAVNAGSGELIEKIDWTVSCNAPHVHDTYSCKKSTSVNDTAANLAMTTADGSSYRVFEFPIESPIHGERTLATEPALESASPFGWHDTDGLAGAEFTTTRGNNVNAYEDINDINSGFSPDGGEDLTFDFEYNPNELPENYTNAAIANLFYANNRIHDILVGYGFDEVSGNFQETNYQSEGFGGDFVRAEAQDGGGINNANFATPPDGQQPRMQMYLWDTGGNTSDIFTVNAPVEIAGSYTSSNFSEFGPGVEPGGITADLAIMVDADGSNNGCNPAVNAEELDGKIAVTYRGTCNFTDKVFNAQEAGAVACIVINNQGGVIDMGGFSGDINIPSIMVSQNDGALIADQIDLGITVNATLIGNDGENFNDGSFDNGIVIHEYGHGISNRLTGGPNVSGCLSNEEQMGEGWSDYYAIILTMDMESSNPVNRPMATFANGEEIDGIGIRPVPYDTSFAVNDYTYADVSDPNLSVPHGVGFVWSTMLWDLTWTLIDEYGYDADIINGTGGNNISIQLVTDAMKLQACQPGFVDGRDAILAADELNYAGANECLIWEVFAKRGLGFSAEQGSTQSRADGVAAFDIPPQCQTILNAPNAAFSVNTNQTCSGVVQFTDESTDIPQSWLWDFGDGNTSEESNPVHQYAEPGTYTVSLTVTNTLGEDTETITDVIEFGFPDSPVADGASGCEGEMVTLSGTTATGEIQWTDSNGEVIGEGDEVVIELGATTSSYFATAVQSEFEPEFVGPPNVNFGTGGNHATEFIGTVDFETFQPLVIESALVVSGATGP